MLPELRSYLIGEKITEGFMPYAQIIDSTPIITQWMYGAIDFVFGRSLTARHLLAFGVLLFQACYWGIILINRKAYAENTYVPSFIFILLCAFSFDVLTITDTLLASGFLLLAITNLFKEIEFRSQQDDHVLKLGFYISLASLAEFSFAIFFIGAFLLLALFTRTTLRKYLLYTVGFLLPHLLLITCYYYSGHLSTLWAFFYLPSLQFVQQPLISVRGLLLLSSVPLFYFLVSFFILNRAARLTNYQSQLVQAMIIWLLIGVVQLFFVVALRPQSVLPILPPLSFLLAHFLLAIRRRRFAEFHAWMLLIGIVITGTLSRFNYFEAISYQSLFVNTTKQPLQQQQVLTLTNDVGIYTNNQLATGIIEWRISKTIFEQPNSYENVLFVRQQFLLNKPSVIVDPKNLMKPFFEKIPELNDHYQYAAGVHTTIKK
jgi:hypothetical protein